MKIEVRKYDGENTVVGEAVEDAGAEESGDFAVCAVLDDRIEVLGAFTNHQAEACRDLLHKVTPDTVVIMGPWAKGQLLDETSETGFCEWGVFRTHPDDEPELLEVFAFRSDAAEALAAVQRYRNLVTYSLAEMRAAVQMMQWVQISAFMTKEEPVRSREILALAKRVGHQAFRDIFVGLAPIHVEAQALGMQANGITDYNRSHDNAWTMCFLAMLTEITDTGIRVLPDWQEKAIWIWGNMKDEIDQGIYPDHDAPFRTTPK